MGIKKVPFAYEHPSRKRMEAQKPTVAADQQTTTYVEPAQMAIKEKREVANETKTAVSKCAVSETNDVVTMRLVFYPPSSGQIKIYDDMIAAGLTSKQAILGLLKRALPAFEKQLLAGKISNQASNFNKTGTAIETNRVASKATFERAKQVFDPFDVLSNRALGSKVGNAIMELIEKDASNG